MHIRIDTQFDPDNQGPILLNLMEQYARDIAGKDASLPEGVRENLPRELVERSNIVTAIAFADETPAGFCVAIDSFSTFACKPVLNIHDIFVAKEFRGRKIAEQLLQTMEAAAVQKGCCKLTLEVLEHNTPALTLYRRYGFTAHTQDPALGNGLFFEKKI